MYTGIQGNLLVWSLEWAQMLKLPVTLEFSGSWLKEDLIREKIYGWLAVKQYWELPHLDIFIKFELRFD